MIENTSRDLRMEAEKKVLGTRWDQKPELTAEEEKLVVQYMEKIRKEKAASSVNAFNINFSDTTKYLDSVHSVAAHAHFELARAFENFDEPLSAIGEYQQSLAYTFARPDTATNTFRAQVLFSWIELDHELGKAEQRDSLIAILTKNYGETIYAQQAGKEYAGIRDKDSPGEVAFRAAYASLRSSGIDNAKSLFLSVVNDHKHEDVAARSLYTIGVSYEDKARFDSAVVYYRRVYAEYPYSKYAEYLKPRMQYAMREPPRPPQKIESVTNIQTQSAQKIVQDTVKPNQMITKPIPPKAIPPKKK